MTNTVFWHQVEGGQNFLFKVEGFFLNKREYFGAEKYNVAKQNYLG